jgi:crotonobetainyl-CoA:carnitine CoA-transferase CaiB-like acyl-CoA transferase
VRFSRSSTQALAGQLKGAHTDAILEELGYDDDAVGDLVAHGIVVDGSAAVSIEASR